MKTTDTCELNLEKSKIRIKDSIKNLYKKKGVELKWQ